VILELTHPALCRMILKMASIPPIILKQWVQMRGSAKWDYKSYPHSLHQYPTIKEL
jgi:hypothetical protein